MRPYPFNPFLDSLRLVRGTLFDKSMDPYIQNDPRRIRSRKSLFLFNSIQDETGNYEFNYAGYKPYISPQPLLMHHLPAKYGRHAFQHLMDSKAERIEQISRLLEQSSINVEATAQCWMDIGNWVSKHVESNQEHDFLKRTPTNSLLLGELKFRPLWYSLLTDLALLLGEQLIYLKPEYSWQFWADINCHNPGSLGRSIWVLREPLPTHGKWHHQPCRITPFSTLCDTTSSFLKDKKAGKSRVHNDSFGWGFMFKLLTDDENQQGITIDAPADDRVIEFLEYFDSYKELPGYNPDHDTPADRTEALNVFLQSYINDHGYLPPTDDLQYLAANCGTLPDWVEKRLKS
ncbi:MAG: hypothetical protein ACRBHB_13725 [Arenicella sp.]